MMELLNNPVTIIAGLLALSFFVIGYGRRFIAGRDRPRTTTDEKPYQVSNPYDPPVPQDSTRGIPPPPAQVLNTPSEEPAPRFFKQFGMAEPSGDSTVDTSGYVWE